MENENKQLSLEDLGLTKVETPAEQAAAAHKEETTQEPVVENIVAKDTEYVEEEKLIATNRVSLILDGGKNNIKKRYQIYGGELNYENRNI